MLWSPAFFSLSWLSQHQSGAEFLVDLAQLLFSVDIGLVIGLDTTTATIIAAAAKFALRAAHCKGTIDDSNALLPSGVLDQD